MHNEVLKEKIKAWASIVIAIPLIFIGIYLTIIVSFWFMPIIPLGIFFIAYGVSFLLAWHDFKEYIKNRTEHINYY